MCWGTKRAEGEGQECEDRQPEGMELGQDAEHGVGGVQVDPGGDLLHIRGEVAVGEHDALGAAAGAGGVEQAGQVVERRSRRPAELGHRAEVERLEGDEVAHARRAFEVFEHGADGEDGVAAAVVDDILELVGLEEVVERDDGAAEHPGTEPRDGEGAAGGEEQADGLGLAPAFDLAGDMERRDEQVEAAVGAAVVDDQRAAWVGQAGADDREVNGL